MNAANDLVIGKDTISSFRPDQYFYENSELEAPVFCTSIDIISCPTNSKATICSSAKLELIFDRLRNVTHLLAQPSMEIYVRKEDKAYAGMRSVVGLPGNRFRTQYHSNIPARIRNISSFLVLHGTLYMAKGRAD